MVHRVVWRVASEEALSFWEERLRAHGIESQRSPGRLECNDPEGLGLALTVSTVADQPLIAEHPEIPSRLALQGFDAVRAYTFDPDRFFFSSRRRHTRLQGDWSSDVCSSD